MPEKKQTRKSPSQASRPRSRRPRSLELAERAQLSAINIDETPDGQVVELDPDECGGRRTALLFPGRGIDAVAEVPAPNLGDDDTTYLFLGRLAALAGQQRVTPALSRNADGTTTVLLRAHRCDDTPDSARELVDDVTLVAHAITEALEASDEEWVEVIARRLLPQLGAFAQTEVEGRPVIVPTLDPDQRARMVELSEGLKST